MPRVAFPIQTFTDAEGAPLSFGFLLISLSNDAQTPDPAQIGYRIKSRLDLDINGMITGMPTFWANALLTPNNTVYLLSTYKANGQLVLKDVSVVVSGGGGGFGVAFGSDFGS